METVFTEFSFLVQVKFMKHMQILRRKLVYELFIEQFVEMARVSIKYRSMQQTMGLLKQAERICSLLNDDKFTDEAENYRALIDLIKQNAQEVSALNVDGPELPRRESIANREAIKIRFRPKQPKDSVVYPAKIDEVSSDDDNDEIYNYHQSVFAQIHATSTENLARFQHTDDHDDDDIDEVTNSIEKLEANLTEEDSDCESVSATKL